LAPYLPDFPYKPTEVGFIGKPIDFIVFKGMDEREPSEVVFVEVKSGKSGLSPMERKLKKLIDKKRSLGRVQGPGGYHIKEGVRL